MSILFEMPKEKKCRDCARFLSLTEFGPEHRRPGTLSPRCKSCGLTRSKNFYKKHATKRRRGALEHYYAVRRYAKYGLTKAKFDDMWRSQEGRCAICCEPLRNGGNGVHVDHDHATGAVRGLLCSQCNHGVGHFRDNPHYCIAAASYLRRNAVRGSAG